MRALKFITGHVIYNLAYTFKFQLKTTLAVIKWVIMLPLYALAKITIPDCRKEAWAKSYILTFVMAILWISMYSYLMVSFF